MVEEARQATNYNIAVVGSNRRDRKGKEKEKEKESVKTLEADSGMEGNWERSESEREQASLLLIFGPGQVTTAQR